MTRRIAIASLCALGLCTAILGCDTSVPTLPLPPVRLVVHGVLDPRSATQVILLQESRPSRKPISTATHFDPDEPIISWGETPVTNARVVVYAANGDSAVAAEDRTFRPDGKGAGVYRIWSGSIVAPPASAAGAFLPVHQGERYKLRITSTFGVAQGSTLVPSSSAPFEGGSRSIDMQRDSVRMRPTQAAAAGFMYRDEVNNQIQSFNDRFRRDLELRLILPSQNDDWAFAFNRYEFQVGTLHTLSVVAVDSNYLAYNGTDIDPFAGNSDRTALTGAVGLFGSVLPLFVLRLQIVRR
jgi:hypothetical protein